MKKLSLKRIGLISVCFVVAFTSFLCFGKVSAKAEEAASVTVNEEFVKANLQVSGYSLRLPKLGDNETRQGIRATVTMTDEMYNALDGTDYTTGTLFIAKANAGDAEITLDTADVSNTVTTDGWYQRDDAKRATNVVLVGIEDEHINTSVIARGYITVDGTTYYSEAGNPVSMASIARSLYDSDGVEDATKDILKNAYLPAISVSIDGEAIEDVIYGDKLTAPVYVSEANTYLKGYYNTAETGKWDFDANTVTGTTNLHSVTSNVMTLEDFDQPYSLNSATTYRNGWTNTAEKYHAQFEGRTGVIEVTSTQEYGNFGFKSAMSKEQLEAVMEASDFDYLSVWVYFESTAKTTLTLHQAGANDWKPVINANEWQEVKIPKSLVVKDSWAQSGSNFAECFRADSKVLTHIFWSTDMKAENGTLYVDSIVFGKEVTITVPDKVYVGDTAQYSVTINADSSAYTTSVVVTCDDEVISAFDEGITVDKVGTYKISATVTYKGVRYTAEKTLNVVTADNILGDYLDGDIAGCNPSGDSTAEYLASYMGRYGVMKAYTSGEYRNLYVKVPGTASDLKAKTDAIDYDYISVWLWVDATTDTGAFKATFRSKDTTRIPVQTWYELKITAETAGTYYDTMYNYLASGASTSEYLFWSQEIPKNTAIYIDSVSLNKNVDLTTEITDSTISLSAAIDGEDDATFTYSVIGPDGKDVEVDGDKFTAEKTNDFYSVEITAKYSGNVTRTVKTVSLNEGLLTGINDSIEAYFVPSSSKVMVNEFLTDFEGETGVVKLSGMHASDADLNTAIEYQNIYYRATKSVAEIDAMATAKDAEGNAKYTKLVFRMYIAPYVAGTEEVRVGILHQEKTVKTGEWVNVELTLTADNLYQTFSLGARCGWDSSNTFSRPFMYLCNTQPGTLIYLDCIYFA